MKDPNARLSAYLLPNLITTGNLFWGFFSVVKSLQGQYAWAASALFLAAIFDMLDGRVARMTGGTSAFGVQYDSLCDLVSFGLAPAFLAFQYGLHGIGRPGWICCFIFLACGALRLARFNVISGRKNSGGDFVGLPIPMAAMVVGSFILLAEDLKASASVVAPVAFLRNLLANETVVIAVLVFLTLVAAAAMVSNIRYFSQKSIKFGSLKPFQLMTLLVVLVGLVAYQPEAFGFLLAVGYALSGPVDYLLGRKSAQADGDDIFNELGDGDDPSRQGGGPGSSTAPRQQQGGSFDQNGFDDASFGQASAPDEHARPGTSPGPQREERAIMALKSGLKAIVKSRNQENKGN